MSPFQADHSKARRNFFFEFSGFLVFWFSDLRKKKNPILDLGTGNYFKESECPKGLDEYQTQYIDPFVALLKKYPSTPVALILEPDSLPNLATNLDDARCANPATQRAYKDGIAYAVKKFSETHAVIYLDGAHGGWLGWQNNLNAIVSAEIKLEFLFSDSRVVRQKLIILVEAKIFYDFFLIFLHFLIFWFSDFRIFRIFFSFFLHFISFQYLILRREKNEPH